MYDRILVPVDGSATANRGLEEALKVAAKPGSSVRVIHVVDDMSLATAAGTLAANVGELLMALASGGEQILADAKRTAQSGG